MKKIYSLMAALLMLLMCSTTVSAGTTIGNTDNSAGWWTAFSDGYTIESGKAYRFQFKNYSGKANSWNNWVLVAATNGTRDAVQGYSEYFALRNDSYAWGPNNSKQVGVPQNTAPENAGSIFSQHVIMSNNFDWDNFKNDMDGSTVDMTVKYEKGKDISVYATIKTSVSKEYTYTFKYNDTSVLTADNITAFFTVDGAHIEEFTAENIQSPSEIVGFKDFSTGYLGARSTPVTLKPGQQYQYKFINHNNVNDANRQNWHNWIFAASQNGQDKVVVRADNYETVKGNNLGCTSNYNWDTFKDDYNGAEVTLTITYTTDNVLQTHAMIKKNDNGSYVHLYDYDYNSTAGGITLSGDLSIALSVEKAWLEIMEEKFVGPLVQENATGLTDCSTGYLGATTEKKTLTPGGKAYVYEFINHNDATNASPFNWIAVVSKNDNNIAIVRADNWEVIGGKSDGFTSAIKWDTFMSDLHDAKVTVTVEYSAANVLTITAKTKKATTLAAKPLKATNADDDFLAPYSWSSEKAELTITGDIQVAMSVDHSWIEMLSEGFDNTTGIRNISAADVKAKKTMRNGKLYIKTAKGTFNAAGAIVEK